MTTLFQRFQDSLLDVFQLQRKTTDLGTSTYSTSQPGTTFPNYTAARSVLSAIISRIATDAASFEIHHARLDEKGRFLYNIDGPLENAISFRPNIDQPAFIFFKQFYQKMLEEGTTVIVPTMIRGDLNSGFFSVHSVRTAKPVEWFPAHVRVETFREETQRGDRMIVRKDRCAIVENPFASLMNSVSSSTGRLATKLAELDRSGALNGKSKLDMLVRVPYTLRGDKQKADAEARRKQLEDQLVNASLGVGYVDAVEEIIQLNRPVTNVIFEEVERLNELLHNQLGLTKEIMSGTASPEQMKVYESRTIEPLLKVTTQALRFGMLTQTARSQGQTIMYTRNFFGMLTIEKFAEAFDKLNRAKVLTPNDGRSIIQLPPSDEAGMDSHTNPNMGSGQNGSEASPPQ